MNAPHDPLDTLVNETLLRPLLKLRNAIQLPTNCTGLYLHNCTGTDRPTRIILFLMIRNSRVLLAAGPYEFAGTLELEAAPVAVACLINQFPLEETLQYSSCVAESAWLAL